jgi:glucose-1-phosphate adenylyltransferase
MYDRRWPIWTYREQLAPAKFVDDSEGGRGTAANSLVSGGCIVSGATVTALGPVLRRARALEGRDRPGE